MIVPTTASVAYAPLANGTGVLAALPPYGRIQKVVYGGACRLRIYKTAAGRTADSARAATTAYTGGAGLLYEYVAVGAETDNETPVNIGWDSAETTYYYNLENGPDNVTIYYAES
jgi:hypothetical protein